MTVKAHDRYDLYAGDGPFRIRIPVTQESDGRPKDLTGASGIWWLHAFGDPATVILSKQTGDGLTITDNEALVTLSEAEIEALNAPNMFEDRCRLTDAEGTKRTVMHGPVHLLTSPPEA